jgi:phenylacetate-coenzyme A ligase PaaK-like adenylate-forming protein
MRITPLDPWIARRIGAESPVNRSAIETYQLERLNETLALAATGSRFYTDRIPSRIDSLDALATLPFTTADDLRADPLRFVCGSQGRINRVVTLDTSGTTGRPKRIAFTTADQELTVDFFAVGMSTFTRAGDRVAILLPGETPGSVGDLLATALRRIGATPLQHGPVLDPPTGLQRLIDDRADVVVGIPTHLLTMARSPAPQPSLREVLVSTDHLPYPIRRAIEDVWGCRVYDHYGMTEMGLGGGVECEAHHGYHMREADMIIEIVDPGSGDEVAAGRPGEVVLTTITRTGMPLIRYRTGDVSRHLPGACSCGSAISRLESIHRRLDGTVEIAGTMLAMPDLDDVLFGVDGIIGFDATVSGEDGSDRLTLSVATTDSREPEALRSTLLADLPRLSRVDLRIETASVATPVLGKRQIRDLKS